MSLTTPKEWAELQAKMEQWNTTTNTTTGTWYPPATAPYISGMGLGQAVTTPDHRDREIESLRLCLHEAYAEIGRLHETIRGMQAFDKFSENLKKAQP